MAMFALVTSILIFFHHGLTPMITALIFGVFFGIIGFIKDDGDDDMFFGCIGVMNLIVWLFCFGLG